MQKNFMTKIMINVILFMATYFLRYLLLKKKMPVVLKFFKSWQMKHKNHKHA